MSKPKTLLEDLCEHALSCGTQSIEVECKDGREWVFARRGAMAFGIASFKSSSRDAKELRQNLYAARKKPVRAAIGGRVWILKVGVYDSFGEDAFRVRIDPAPKGNIWRSFATTRRSTAGHPRNQTSSDTFRPHRRLFTR
jgi:hypothetical protein